jgi:uncharacterized OB-fold protein
VNAATALEERLDVSPLATFRAHLSQGKLAYQYDTQAGKAIFFPRVIAPGSGNPALELRISQGLGTVYACTVVAPRLAPAYNVVLVDMDEGFRLMSRVEGVPAEEVRIGMRVRVRVVHGTGGAGDTSAEWPYPVFDLEGSQ